MLVAITGASGAQIAIKLLEILKEKGIKVELIISKISSLIKGSPPDRTTHFL